jgi:hypothetical protein
MKHIKKVLLAFIFIAFLAAPVFAVVTPQTSYAVATTPADCEKPILGIQPWFKGLTTVDSQGRCGVISPDGTKVDLKGFIWRIALNVIGMALTVVGYIAFFFIIFGGFQFLTGGNNPSQIEKARKTLLNAVIGLIISIGAVAVVNLIFNVVGPISTVNGISLPAQSADAVLKNGLNIVYGLVGVVAIITIIIGGITYATSAGNSANVTKGKNLLLYAIIGLAVVFSAFALTNFVFLRFK